MCGIVALSRAGAAAPGAADGLAARADGALRAMRWRGPDGHGVTTRGDGAVGMCRLRVRSAPEERVPFAGGDDAYALCGEVYGAGRPGAVHRVAGGLAEARYAAGVDQGTVDGMWAVARLHEDGTVDLRRDPWGIKPLWLREARDEVLACSELPALLQGTDGPPPRVRQAAVAQLMLFGGVVDGGSYWEDVFPLPPGGAARLRHGRVVRLGGAAAQPAGRPTGSLAGALRRSVAAVLQSERPLGLAVSGGLDSSIIALHVQDEGIEDFATVSVTPEGAADGVTDLRALGLPDGVHRAWRHHHVTVRPRDLLTGLREATEITGIPTGLTSAPLYLALARAARDAGIVVLLVGEGADELFGGYRSYLTVGPDTTPFDFYLRPRRAALVDALLGAGPRRAAAGVLRERLRGTGAGLAAVLACERTMSLGPLLDRTDALTMSCSIEARTPFLHGGVPWHAASLRPGELVDGGQTKVALRAAYADRLPQFANEVKTPFRAPWERWLREGVLAGVETLLHDGAPALDGLGVRRAGVREVLAAAALGDPVAADLCFLLCSLVFWADGRRVWREAS